MGYDDGWISELLMWRWESRRLQMDFRFKCFHRVQLILPESVTANNATAQNQYSTADQPIRLPRSADLSSHAYFSLTDTGQLRDNSAKLPTDISTRAALLTFNLPSPEPSSTPLPLRSTRPPTYIHHFPHCRSADQSSHGRTSR